MELSGEDKDSLTVDEVAVIVPTGRLVLGSTHRNCLNLPLDNVGQPIVLDWNISILLSN